MAWVRIDDGFYDSGKWDAAPADSVGLWVAAMAWCNRNDEREDAQQGIIPEFKLRSLLVCRNLKATLADLVERRALYEVEGGYMIHDYAEYQQNEKVQAIRDKRREAGRKGAKSRWGDENQNGKSDGKPIANAMASANGKLCPGPGPGPGPVSVPKLLSVSRPTTSDEDDDGRVLQALQWRAWAAAQRADDPASYARTVLASDAIERAPIAWTYLESHPDATAEEIAMHALGVREIDVARAKEVA